MLLENILIQLKFCY
jgi:hypothetical protein